MVLVIGLLMLFVLLAIYTLFMAFLSDSDIRGETTQGETTQDSSEPATPILEEIASNPPERATETTLPLTGGP